MVSSFSNPGFPPVHAHPTRLPAMDTRLSAALDSFEASMRAALRESIREAMDSALTAIHKAVNPVLAAIRSDIAQLHRDLALGIEGDSDPASMCSEEAASIEVGHQKPHNGDGNPLRIPLTIHGHSTPPLLSSSPMLRALADSTVKQHSNKSAASTVLLPESKTMISAPQLLHAHSFSDTTESGPEVVLNLSIISATLEATFPSLLTDNYCAYLKDKFGWVTWYLVGKFVKKDFYALELFEKMSKKGSYDKMEISHWRDLYSFEITTYIWNPSGCTIIVELLVSKFQGISANFHQYATSGPPIWNELSQFTNVGFDHVAKEIEIYVQLHESVRGCGVSLVQPACPPANEKFMEFLVMSGACRLNVGRRIHEYMLKRGLTENSQVTGISYNAIKIAIKHWINFGTPLGTTVASYFSSTNLAVCLSVPFSHAWVHLKTLLNALLNLNLSRTCNIHNVMTIPGFAYTCSLLNSLILGPSFYSTIETSSMLSSCVKQPKLILCICGYPLAFTPTYSTLILGTEPHSKRVQVTWEVQLDVFHGANIGANKKHRCESCARVQPIPVQWVVSVQVHQHASPYPTFLYLEQLILKHGAVASAIESTAGVMASLQKGVKQQQNSRVNYKQSRLRSVMKSSAKEITFNQHFQHALQGGIDKLAGDALAKAVKLILYFQYKEGKRMGAFKNVFLCLSAMVPFLAEFSYIFVDFDEIVHASLDNYEPNTHNEDDVKVTQLDGTKLSYPAKHTLIATGSRVQRLAISGQELGISSAEALSWEELPKPVVALREGYIAVDWWKMGASVNIFSRKELPLRGLNDEIRAVVALELKTSPFTRVVLQVQVQDSLDRHAKTMVVHASSDEDSFSETICTLQIAQRVYTVELGAARLRRMLLVQTSLSFLSLEDKANFQGGSIVMTQIIIEVYALSKESN